MRGGWTWYNYQNDVQTGDNENQFKNLKTGATIKNTVATKYPCMYLTQNAKQQPLASF